MAFKIHWLDKRLPVKKLSEVPIGSLVVLRSGKRAGDVVYRVDKGAVSLTDPYSIYTRSPFPSAPPMQPDDPLVEFLPPGKYELEVTA